MEEAACILGEPILKWLGPSPYPILLGHNVQFDKQFLTQIFNCVGLKLDYSYLTIDTLPISMLLLGKASTNEMFDCLCMEERGQHNALEDAYMTLEAAKTMKRIFEKGLGND